MTTEDIGRRLSRPDKWYLGNGRGAAFAPPFPRYLRVPGFWDECHFADIRLDRLFRVFLFDSLPGGQPKPLPLQSSAGQWRPQDLGYAHFAYADDDDSREYPVFSEERVVTPTGTFVSRWRFDREGERPFGAVHLLLWSLQQKEPLAEGKRMATVAEPSLEPDCLTFAHRVQGERGIRDVWVALGCSLPRQSYLVSLSEMHATEPLWDVTMLEEAFRDGKLPDTFTPDADWRGSIFGASLLHLYQHYSLEIQPGRGGNVTFGASVALDRKTAIANLRRDMASDPARESHKDWRRYYQICPAFTSGDKHLDTYLPYRYYGLRLSTVDVADEPLAFPCVFEGIGMFRSFISYSAQAHMREARWLGDGGRLAEGILRGMLHVQEPSGFIPGHTYTVRDARAFYHADWGDAALSVFAVTGNREWLADILPGLARYAEYFDRERDREGSGLYDIFDQNETGQEYMSRYLFADPDADDWRPIRLKGVDATVYLYRLQRALAEMERLLEAGDGADWDARAARTKAAIRDRMWDPEGRMFFDVNPETGERSPYLSVVGFYPFLADIAGPEHLPAIYDHLLNPGEFWTPYPVPASPLTDPYFDAEARWKGKRTNCPWNGRTWPMTNSHIADALAHTARTLDPSLRPIAADFILRFVRMMFFDGDPSHPNCFEHYNPLTGAPSRYRGIDDYMHSWVADLYVRHLCGVLPGVDGSLTVDPLWQPETGWKLENLPWRGKTLAISWQTGEGIVVSVDGEERYRGGPGEGLTITDRPSPKSGS